MKLIRTPNIKEKNLLELLIEKSSLKLCDNWKETLLVCSMNDGGMGSLYLFPDGKIVENRKFGKQVSDFQFTDLDGVEVIASLNVDKEGNLFELDIWKTDYSKLLSLPDL